MTTDMLGPIAGLDAAKAYKRYFGSLAKTRDHNGLDFGLVIDSAVMLSVETLWPSILKLSRRAVAGDIAAADGWTIKSVSTGDAGDSAFVMENDELPGGFLFNCRFRIERIAEVDKEVVSGVMCCAYRGDGLFPPGYSGFGDDLDETVKIGFDGGKCQSGQIFSYRPSVHLQLVQAGSGSGSPGAVLSGPGQVPLPPCRRELGRRRTERVTQRLPARVASALAASARAPRVRWSSRKGHGWLRPSRRRASRRC